MENIDFIVDANILFSALISGKSIYPVLFGMYRFSTIDYVFTELDLHRQVILEKTRLEEIQFIAYLEKIFSKITIYPNMILGEEASTKAYQLCKTVDVKDAPYVALAIQLNQPLATRDEKLYEALRKQKFKNIMLLQDILTTL
jgi:predicted nucleic acid-binding protein